MLSVIVNGLLRLASLFGPTTEVGKDVLKAVQSLAKHVPPGSSSQGTQNSAMTNLMRQRQQQQPLAAVMQAKGTPPAAQA